jgi:hypothetical protein
MSSFRQTPNPMYQQRSQQQNDAEIQYCKDLLENEATTRIINTGKNIKNKLTNIANAVLDDPDTEHVSNKVNNVINFARKVSSDEGLTDEDMNNLKQKAKNVKKNVKNIVRNISNDPDVSNLIATGKKFLNKNEYGVKKDFFGRTQVKTPFGNIKKDMFGNYKVDSPLFEAKKGLFANKYNTPFGTLKQNRWTGNVEAKTPFGSISVNPRLLGRGGGINTSVNDQDSYSPESFTFQPNNGTNKKRNTHSRKKSKKTKTTRKKRKTSKK